MSIVGMTRTIETTDPIGSWVEARSSHTTKQTKNIAYTRADERQQRQLQQQFCRQCPILSGIETVSDHSSPSSLTVKILYDIYVALMQQHCNNINTKSAQSYQYVCVCVYSGRVQTYMYTYHYHYVKRTRAMQSSNGAASSSSRTACTMVMLLAMLLCTQFVYF